MKVKGPIQVKGLYFYGENTDVEVSIPAADLIAELEKRRPCERCEVYEDIPVYGCDCVWDSIGKPNNFKPKSEEKQ